MELFRERGSDATTTAEIAARAGVTERTFFRHFPDKREVLFDGEEAFRDALAEGVRAAPEDLGPIEALLWAFRSVEPLLQLNRAFSEPRRQVIARTPDWRPTWTTSRHAARPGRTTPRRSWPRSARGDAGSTLAVKRVVSRLVRTDVPSPDGRGKAPSSRQVSWLLFRRDAELAAADRAFVADLCTRCPPLADAR